MRFSSVSVARTLLLVMSTGLLLSCANQSYLRRDADFRPSGWTTIVVMPFTGDQQYAALATSTFTLQMVGRQHFKLVQPETTVVELRRLGIEVTPEGISIIDAQRVAHVLNAQAILVGNIEAYSNGMTLNAFATVRVVDASSGQIVAASHQPSGLLMAYSVQQCVVAAIENVADDVNDVLSSLSRQTATPTSQEAGVRNL